MEFGPLRLSDKHAVEDALRPLRRNDATLGFANLYSLQGKYGIEAHLEDGVLFVRQMRRFPDGPAYLTPLGSRDLACDVRRLQRDAHDAGVPLRLVNVTQDERRLLDRELPGLFSFEADRAFSEYLYRTETIAALSGHGLAKKRREAGKFDRLYGDRVTYEPLCADMLDEARSYQERWFDQRGSGGTDEHPLEAEHRKILLDLDLFEQLGLEGIALRIDGRLEGYAYGALLFGGAFDIMVLKASLEYRFSWRALVRQLARMMAGRAELLNMEEDLGLPGLRESKLGYRPCALIEKHTAVERR